MQPSSAVSGVVAAVADAVITATAILFVDTVVLQSFSQLSDQQTIRPHAPALTFYGLAY